MEFNKIGRWGMSSLGGILVMLFGFTALAFPNVAVKALAVYFALSILIGGIVLTTYAIQYRKITPNWKTRLLEGIISLVLGIVIILNPESAAAFLMIIIGAWAAIIGLVFIVTFFARKTSQMVDVLNLTTGIISLVLGAIIIFNPFESSRFIVILVGIYAIIYGIVTMVFSSKIINNTED